MWKRLRESFKIKRTCAGQYTKIDLAGLHISYDHMWWFMAKQSIKGDAAIQRMAEAVFKQVTEEMNEQQHSQS